MLKGNRILVLGGAGFIGSHVVEELVEREAIVTVVDRSASSKPTNLASVQNAIDIITLNVNTPGFIDFFKNGSFDTVLHLSGSASVPKSIENPYEDFEECLQGTLKL